MLLVRDFLERTATRLPEKVALVCGARRFRYAELDRAANRFAHTLIKAGVHRGDRVGICLRNGVEAVVAIFAVAKASAVFVPVNPATKPDKLAKVLADCGATALVTDEGHAVAGEGIIESCRLFTPHDCFSAETTNAAPPPRHNVDLDLACLIYTSGSTGEPKGVMCDHSNVEFVSGSIIEYLGIVEQDVMLNVLPLSFSYGLYQLLNTFRTGGTLVLEASFAYPAAILNRMVEERVTGFAGVPTIYSLLLRTDLQQFDLSALRYCTNAAAALPAEHVRQLRQALPHVQLFLMHGLTETARTLYLPPALVDAKPGSVGVAIPGTEAWLEDESGQRVGSHCTGELVVRGRHVMRGYWNDAKLSAERFPSGTLNGDRICRTGDLFRMDDDGCFYFVARKDDIIKCRGEKVAPKDVENILYTLPGVTEAAVFGVPDPILGQAVKAVIATDGRIISVAEVIQHCRQHLEDFMVPRFVEFCAALPKTDSGKVKKSELKCAALPASAT